MKFDLRPCPGISGRDRRKHFRGLWLPKGCPAALLAVALLSLVPVPASMAGRLSPNVLLVLADDLGWGDLGCYNPGSKIPTPNLDRLAAEGMRFTDAHSSSSVCTPTRYALLTGRYAWRTRLQSGVLWGYSPPLIAPGRLTLASLLRQQGYVTAAVGKWHLGLGWPTREPVRFGDQSRPAADPAQVDYSRPFKEGPLTAGFDSYFGIPASLDMDPYFYVADDRAAVPPTNRVEGSRHQRQGGGGFWRAGPVAPGFTHESCLPALADKAEAFLERQTVGRPFFLYFALTAPHDPWVPTLAYRGRSGAGDYGDFVVQVDATIGRLLRTLEARGLAENTLVIVTSDNGAHWPPGDNVKHGHRANGPWRGQKADLFEGGHRVPLLARWPGVVKAGTVSDALIGLNDVMATVADILDAKLPKDAAEDSLSFLPALRGKKRGNRESLVHHSIQGSFAIREASWKLLLAPDSGGWSAPTPGSAEAARLPAMQLYNLDRDPGERNNLVGQEPKRVARMRRMLEEWILSGRSTRGAAQSNDVVIRWEKDRKSSP